MKNLFLFTIVLAICNIFSTDLHAQKRVALIIGNGNYHEQALKNPVNDANDLATTLRNLGFEVILKLNANQQAMESAVQSFGTKLQGNTVGLFYYSGHAMQYEGSNYLIPIGAMASVSAPEHLRYKTVDAGYVLGVMKNAGNNLNMVILDACRDNPFKSFSRGMVKGLKRISGAEGTIIAYSTSPGNVALDGNGRNSPYTEQLIKMMKVPNLPVELMFKQIRKGVKGETGGQQSPWYEASIDGDFYFTNTIVDEESEEIAHNEISLQQIDTQIKRINYLPSYFSTTRLGMSYSLFKLSRLSIGEPNTLMEFRFSHEEENIDDPEIESVIYYFDSDGDQPLYELIIDFKDEFKMNKYVSETFGEPNHGKEWRLNNLEPFTVMVWTFNNTVVIAGKIKGTEWLK